MRMNEPKKTIDHMVFNVRNLEEAVRFYTEVVGMKVVMRFDDRKMAFLSFGDRLGDVRLFETGGTADPDRQIDGFNHVAFQPEGGLPALEQLHRRLIDKGAKIDRLEQHAGGGHRSVYFFDPDGNRLEFYWESPEWRAESTRKVEAAFNPKHKTS